MMEDKTISHKIYHKVLTPAPYSDLICTDLDDAKKTLEEFSTSKTEEHKEFWAKMGSKCKIVRVEEVMSEVKWR